MAAEVIPAWLDKIEQSTDLHALEQIVAKGKATFVEVGCALRRIQVAELYKLTHSTWEKYCEQRWGWSGRRAYQLMAAADVATEVGTTVPIASERAARELVRVATPEERATILTEATAAREASGKSGPPTASDIRAITKRTDPMLAAQADPGSDERYTPVEWADLVREVFGGEIDLDPATCRAALAYVPAKRIFTREDNGLEQEWAGRVYLNPPYSQPLMGQFCGKLLAELGKHKVRQAICLTNCAPASSWWQALAVAADCVCLPAKRINFGNSGDRNRFDSSFFYFGPETKEFKRAFGDRGVCGRLR